jgi:hypothetical protein
MSKNSTILVCCASFLSLCYNVELIVDLKKGSCCIGSMSENNVLYDLVFNKCSSLKNKIS